MTTPALKETVISFSDFPEMPAPCWSEDEGEIWDFGNYMLYFQKHPILMYEFIKAVSEKKEVEKIKPADKMLRYLYAMTVKYKTGKNPSGFDSQKPAEVLAIEQIKINNIWQKPCLCCFVPKQHLNVGMVKTEISGIEAKKLFFSILKKKAPDIKPIYIGPIHKRDSFKSPFECFELLFWKLFPKRFRLKKKVPDIEPIYFDPIHKRDSFKSPFECFELLFWKLFPKRFQQLSIKLSATQKLLFLSVIADLLLLIIALINATNHNLPDGYYTFLRIVTCGLFIWLAILHKSPYWRFILGAGAILYNPVFPIHLDSRDPWIFFNILSIVVLVPAFILYIKTAKVNSNDAEKTK